jgi:hypothetical protein
MADAGYRIILYYFSVLGNPSFLGLAQFDPRLFRAIGAAAVLEVSVDPHFIQDISQVGSRQLIKIPPGILPPNSFASILFPLLPLAFSLLMFQSHDLRQSRRLKKTVKRSKRIRNGRRLKAASPLVPGPGSRALPAEIMRHLLFPGPVGPTGLGFPWGFPLLAGAAGGRPIGPPHPAEIGRSLQEKGSPGRCFLRATPLTPGHNPSIPELSNSGSPPAKPGVYSKEIIPSGSRGKDC